MPEKLMEALTVFNTTNKVTILHKRKTLKKTRLYFEVDQNLYLRPCEL